MILCKKQVKNLNYLRTKKGTTYETKLNKYKSKEATSKKHKTANKIEICRELIQDK